MNGMELINSNLLYYALLLGILSGLGRIDSSVIQIYWHRPIVMGPLVGWLLGDLHTGLYAGALLELAWMGLVPLAGAQPPDPVVGGILGVTFAITTGQPPETAVAFALPFAVAAQAVKTLLYNLWIAFAHKADQYARNAETRKIEILHFSSLGFHFLAYGLMVFLPIYLGVPVAQELIGRVPQELMNGLSIAGRVMPAVGLAILLKTMLRKEYFGFLLIGFVLTVYFKLPVMGAAVIGVAIALLQFYNSGNSGKPTREVKKDGI